MLFALLNRDTGNLDDHTSVGGGVPPTPFGNRVWITDIPPAYDATTQQIAVAIPISANATTVPYNITALPLATVKTIKLQALSAYALGRDANGTTFSAVPVFTTDHYKLLYIVYNQLAGTGPQTFSLPDSNGVFHTLDSPTMQGLYAAVANYVAAVLNRQAFHSAAILALADVPSVLAYDFTTGWPA